jgi:hypothetical protein
MIHPRPGAVHPIDIRQALIANTLILAVIVWAWALFSLNGDLYYLSVQEDEYLEWASFWAFISAAIIYLRNALTPPFQFRGAWFLLALSAFCGFIAMEEISWGQRVVGYRPPEYFLEFNFQQELNLHNIVATDLRKLAFQVVTFGYGVGLPLIMLLPGVGKVLQRMGIIAPPVALIPAFTLTGIMQITYPFKFTGEWVELMLGLGFLFAAMATVASNDAPTWRSRTGMKMAIAWLAVIAAGAVSAAATHWQRDANPDNLTAAQAELRALQYDFDSGRVRNVCNTHKRLYTFATRYDQSHLFEGEFARLAAQGLPEQRAAFLLDPWNTAYWLRDNCARGDRERMTYLYSFGPNRRRDSTKWKVGGDDIAIFIRDEAAPQ